MRGSGRLPILARTLIWRIQQFMRPIAILTTVLTVSCLIVTSGCHRNKAKTPADMPTSVDPAPMAPSSTPEDATPPENEMSGTEADFLSGDLDGVNEYLLREGLLRDIYFDLDQSNLAAEARQNLARNAQFLQEHPQFILTLEGHCDERGTDEYNLALGERRVQSAKQYMVTLGVPAVRLSTISYGEERPVCHESEESCWSQNRRAHPVVTGRNSQ
jgi:peptidoglycan-associated lipoprotein